MVSQAVIDLAKKCLPFVIVALCIGAAVVLYNHNINKAHDEGYDAGIAYQKGQQAQVDQEEKARRDADKRSIERQYSTELEAARAAMRFSDATAGRLQQELNRIKQLAESYTGPQSSGTSTRTIVSMLADMLDESNRAYRTTAAEADDYYRAGRACEASYDSLKRLYHADKETSKSASSK